MTINIAALRNEEIAERILNAPGVTDAVEFARQIPLSRILESLSPEEIDAVVNRYQAEEEFSRFVEEKSQELPVPSLDSDPTQSPGEAELNLDPETAVFDASKLTGAADLDELLGHLSQLDLFEVASSLAQEDIDNILGRFGAEARFQGFLVEKGVVPPPAAPAFDVPAPVYDSRFESEEDAIAWAEANGQGELKVLEDGTIVNQYGETMVYDSDGNLAPAPREIPAGMMPDPNDPFGGFIEDPYWRDPADVAPPGMIIDPSAPSGYRPDPYWIDPAALVGAATVDDLLTQLEGVDIAAVAASLGQADIDAILGRFGAEERFQGFLVEKGVVPPPAPPIYDAPAPVYDSRFESEEDAIAWAEANGQGELTYLPDGTLVNRYGETMVYDSSGNLAPAPREIPVGMMPDPNDPFGGFIEDPYWRDPADVAPPGMIIDPSAPSGYRPDPYWVDPAALVGAATVDDLLTQLEGVDIAAVAASLGQADIDAILGRFGAEERFQGFLVEKGVVPPPAPPIYDAPAPVYDSRFESEEDAIAWAEANGQGELTYLPDGTLVNRYGETMVYDSSGNLAPAPRDIPVGMIPDPNDPFGGFMEDPNWVDPAWTDPAGGWVQDEYGNYIPDPSLMDPQPYVPPIDYESRFESEADALEFAEANGQGPLELNPDGSITNQFGETMVYDSDGNLAPAPMPAPPPEWIPEPMPYEPPAEWIPEPMPYEPPAEWIPEPMPYEPPPPYEPFIAY